MARSVRDALVLLTALAACSPGAALHGPKRPDAPYDVPGDAARSREGGLSDQGDPGPIPVTAADPVRGPRLAPVTIVEFADFQCPFCRKAAEVMNDLSRRYPGQIRFVWKHFPLSFHRDARKAAEQSEAVFELRGSDGFFRYHDAVFSSERGLGPKLFDDAVDETGASRDDVANVSRRPAAAAKVEADVVLAHHLGVTGTPAFFVNGVLVHGAQPLENFVTLVDAQLAAARAALAAGTPPQRLYAALTTKNFEPPEPETPRAPPEDTTVYRVPVGASPSLGSPSAPVTIVEFADFQCPYCTRAEPTVQQVRAKYGDQVRLVCKNVPLEFHDRAEPAAELALEARAQKGEAAFWKAHDLLLGAQGKLTDGDLEGVATAAGARADLAMRAVAAHKHRDALDEDADLADDVEATGTPTFFINGRKLVGAQPFEKFASLIDEQLKVAQAALARGVPGAKLYETLQQGATSATLDTASVPPPTSASPSRGPQGAKIVVQIWSDFQCPYCQRVEPTLADLDAAFPGQIRVVWHNRPLSFHQRAMGAAEAALEAFAQKGEAGFWKMHDLLIADQTAHGQDRAGLERHAAEIGLDMARFRDAMDRGVHRAEVAADIKIADAAGLTATPGFVINGYRVVGAQSLARFKRVVKRALAEGKPSP